jgi:hypothetical protein
VFVEFDEYTPGLPGSISIDGRCCVPVFPVTNEFHYDSQECSHTQFPLTLAYAIAVHKAQGISVSSPPTATASQSMYLKRKQAYPPQRLAWLRFN